MEGNSTRQRGSGWARGACVAIGLILMFTAWAKAQDYYGFIEKAVYYRALSHPGLHVGAMATIGAEVLLAACLICGLQLRRLTIPATLLLLLLFTGLITYAWIRFGIEDCGCLGSLAETPPWFSLLKNLLLIAALCWAWTGVGQRDTWRLRLCAAGGGALAGAAWLGLMIAEQW